MTEQEQNDLKVGDKITYCRCTGYKEPGTIVNIRGSIVCIATEDFGKIYVHIANSKEIGSRDWIEK